MTDDSDSAAPPPATTQVPYAEGDLRGALQKFLSDNPEVTFETVLAEGKPDIIHLVNLWGDPTVGLVVPRDYTLLVDALNGLRLPPRFSAIWHEENKLLEVIWTAFRLPADQKVVGTREFDFTFETQTFRCRFGTSSDQLTQIAQYFVPRKVTASAFRNLSSFVQKNLAGEEAKAFGFDVPRSFWIEGLSDFVGRRFFQESVPRGSIALRSFHVDDLERAGKLDWGLELAQLSAPRLCNLLCNLP